MEVKALQFTTDDIIWKPNDDVTGIVIVGRNGTGAAVTVQAEYCSLPVVAIGEGAFEGDVNLTEIALPATVEVIGKRAFKDCTNLSVMN